MTLKTFEARCLDLRQLSRSSSSLGVLKKKKKNNCQKPERKQPHGHTCWVTAKPMTGSPSRISHVTTAELTSISRMVTLSGADSRVSDDNVQPKNEHAAYKYCTFPQSFTPTCVRILSPTFHTPFLFSVASVMPVLMIRARSQGFSWLELPRLLRALHLSIFTYSSRLFLPRAPH